MRSAYSLVHSGLSDCTETNTVLEKLYPKAGFQFAPDDHNRADIVHEVGGLHTAHSWILHVLLSKHRLVMHIKATQPHSYKKLTQPWGTPVLHKFDR